MAALAKSISNPVITSDRYGKNFRPHYPELGFRIRFVSETGLRAGEVAALRMKHLDIAGRRINVCMSATEVPISEEPSGVTYDETKTYETRSVPMTKSITRELRHYLKTRSSDPEAFVFTTVEGGPIHHSNFYQRHFERAVDQCLDEKGERIIPAETRFHDLRHTYATLLIAAGANPLTVMKRMGHSSITVTMDRYGHLFPHLEENITEKMDEGYRAVNGE